MRNSRLRNQSELGDGDVERKVDDVIATVPDGIKQRNVNSKYGVMKVNRKLKCPVCNKTFNSPQK